MHLFASFFYDNSIWLWSSIFVFIVLALVYIILFLAHKFIKPSHELIEDNVISIGFLQVIATAYSVLLAFIAFNVLTVHQDATQVVETEANYISNIFRGVHALPSAIAYPIQNNLIKYLDQIINKEWPEQKIGIIPKADAKGWHALDSVGSELYSSKVGAVNPVLQAEMLSQLDNLYNARRMRILAVSESLPTFMWGIIALGGFIVIGFVAVLGSNNFKLKMIMATIMSISLSLIIVLIISLDRPFRGQLSMDKDSYINIQHNIKFLLSKENNQKNISS